jgi:putative OPT family oligopeptide transporter
VAHPAPAIEEATAPHDFQPFVPAEREEPELTLRAVVIGSLLGIVFAASSVYLGLKVGLTVSASIPVAVLSITLFRYLAKALGLRQATILENNIVQTTGSAGESIAAGVAFTLPSLLLMGFDLELSRVLLVALLGGLIGVLMMIPLRHGLIVKEHGKLAYPEGTACADVLIVGEKGGLSARTVFLGFFVGLPYALLNQMLRLWAEGSHFALSFWGRLKGAAIGFEVSPTMLGVGYIIGPKVSANMLAGGLLAFVVIIPLIVLFGAGMTAPMYPETQRLISEMSPSQLRNSYVLYIGAGAVATGGFIALARSLPTIVGAFRGGMKSLQAGRGAVVQTKRTERDLPLTVVVGGSLALILAIWLAPVLEINFVSAILILLFGFFFVTVSSRITGEIGSSSNPISGMTVATLLLTCGLFVLVGWLGVGYKAMALTTAALVCVAASNGGTISQDLKTGYLVGGTPRAQQLSILAGVITSAIAIGFVLLYLNDNQTTFRPVAFADYTATVPADAPKLAGPDGQSYNVVYMREDVGPVLRGKYLADASGKLQFFVDPGVCGTYPYRLSQASFPGVTLPVPPDAPTELGVDHMAYKVVTLESPAHGVSAGRYLVRDGGEIAYSAATLSKYDAPKAQLFRLIIDGTLGSQLPWGLVLVGVFIAFLMELVGVASLPFAVGLYLPIGTSAAIFVGGLVRWLIDRKRSGESSTEAEFSPGVLMASGLIAGGAIGGVIASGVAASDEWSSMLNWGTYLSWGANESWWPMVPFLAMAVVLYKVGSKLGQSPSR